MSVPYKIGQNDFYVIFSSTVPKNYDVLGKNYFVIKLFVKSFV